MMNFPGMGMPYGMNYGMMNAGMMGYGMPGMNMGHQLNGHPHLGAEGMSAGTSVYACGEKDDKAIKVLTLGTLAIAAGAAFLHIKNVNKFVKVAKQEKAVANQIAKQNHAAAEAAAKKKVTEAGKDFYKSVINPDFTKLTARPPKVAVAKKEGFFSKLLKKLFVYKEENFTTKEIKNRAKAIKQVRNERIAKEAAEAKAFATPSAAKTAVTTQAVETKVPNFTNEEIKTRAKAIHKAGKGKGFFAKLSDKRAAKSAEKVTAKEAQAPEVKFEGFTKKEIKARAKSIFGARKERIAKEAQEAKASAKVATETKVETQTPEVKFEGFTKKQIKTRAKSIFGARKERIAKEAQEAKASAKSATETKVEAQTPEVKFEGFTKKEIKTRAKAIHKAGNGNGFFAKLSEKRAAKAAEKAEAQAAIDKQPTVTEMVNKIRTDREGTGAIN